MGLVVQSQGEEKNAHPDQEQEARDFSNQSRGCSLEFQQHLMVTCWNMELYSSGIGHVGRNLTSVHGYGPAGKV